MHERDQLVGRPLEQREVNPTTIGEANTTRSDADDRAADAGAVIALHALAGRLDPAAPAARAAFEVERAQLELVDLVAGGSQACRELVDVAVERCSGVRFAVQYRDPHRCSSP